MIYSEFPESIFEEKILFSNDNGKIWIELFVLEKGKGFQKGVGTFAPKFRLFIVDRFGSRFGDIVWSRSKVYSNRHYGGRAEQIIYDHIPDLPLKQWLIFNQPWLWKREDIKNIFSQEINCCKSIDLVSIFDDIFGTQKC